jgi:leucyl-tRNA synthetase
VEIDTESDFRKNLLIGVTSRLEYLFSQLVEAALMKGNELRSIDFWMYSKLNSKIKKATAFMDSIMLKSAYNEVFYNSINELRRYHDMGGSNGLVIGEYLTAVVKMIAPIMPHMAEEFWHMLGNKSLVAAEQWPTANDGMVNAALEACEGIIDSTVDDVGNAVQLTGKMDANRGKTVKAIKIIVAEQWKIDARNMLVGKESISGIIRAMNRDNERVASYLQQFKNRNEITERIEVDQQTLFNAFNESRDYMRSRFGAEVMIEREQESGSPRASRALPERPSIEVTWG